MEKDNKYYSIIENIVKNHKKYNGYDAIIDDIIDDVFKHSKTVMNSVKDEDVIISYLQKLVAVSIITVPKRLNFHNELKQTTLIKKEEENNVSQFVNTNTQYQTDGIKTDTPPLAQKENTQKANVDFVDKMINSIDTASVLDNDSAVSKFDTENQSFFDELQESDIVGAEQNLHEDTSDTVLSGDEREILELNLENAIIEESAEPETVDSFTDDEPVSFESDDLTTEEQPEELAIVDSFTDDEPVSFESDDLTTEEQPEELAIVDSFTDDEPVSFESDDLLAEDTVDIQLQEDDNNQELNLLSDENNDNSSIDILSLDNDNNPQIQEFEDIQEINALDEDDSFKNNLDYDDNITIGLADDNSVAKEESEPEYALVDYSPFSYIPEIKDIDADLQNIESKLIDLNRQKPELNILKIFDLRYKQNLPINKIAVDLNIQKQTVLQAIDEIVELI